MTLAQKTLLSTRTLTYYVRIYTTPGTYSGANVLILPADPTSATGVPGIDGIRISKSFDSPVPVCQIDLNRVPTWITRGQGITVDVGYNGLTQRLFTGFIQSRERGIGKGSIQCLGRLWTAFRTVQIGSRSVDGVTVSSAIGTILDYVGLTDNRSLTVPAFTLGTASDPVLERMPASQMLQMLMDIDGCRIYETGTGQIIVKVIDEAPAPVAYKTYTTNANATARILEASDREDPEYYRNRVIVTGTTVTEGTAPDQTSRTITATATNTGSALVQPALPSGTYIDAEYNNHLIDTDAKAAEVAIRLLAKFARIPRQLQIELAGDPELDLGQTIAFVMPEIDLNDRGFISGIEHVIDQNGYVTRLTDFRGAGDTGGTLSQNPIASFTFKSEREVFGSVVNVFAALDASNSFDADGTIASYAWSDNQTTSPEIATLTTQQVLVRADTSAWTGSWSVTLTVTDNDGLTGSTTITIPYANTEAEIVLPAIYAAINNNSSATLDGAVNWNDSVSGSGNIISTGARPADGVNVGHALFGTSTGRIYRTTDACATAPTLVYTSAAAVAMNDVKWDWRNGNVCWAIDENAIVYISVNAGVTWTIYKALRSTLTDSVSSLKIASGSYVGNGTAEGNTQAITGLGFSPKVVVVKGDDASLGHGRIRTSAMATSYAFTSGGTGDSITSLDADGFTVKKVATDATAHTNDNGITYYWYAIGGDNCKTGTYVGNGAAGNAITGIGFTPALVGTHKLSGSDVFYRGSSIAGDLTVGFASGNNLTGHITSLDADGFTLGTAADVNQTGVTYYYFAIKASTNFAEGVYTGNSADSRNLPATPMSFDPVMVQARPTAAVQPAVFKTSSMPAGDSSDDYSAGTLQTNFLQSLTPAAGQFQVGTDARVNFNTFAYHWFAFGSSAGGAYLTGALGNQLGLPAAGGVYVFGGTGAGSPLIAYDPVVGSQAWTRPTLTGDIATDTIATQGDATLRIVDYTAGYTKECLILSWASGGGVSITAVYSATSPPYANSWAFTRASTTFGALKTGRYIVSDNVLIKSNYFLAAFANRSVWTSTDGVAWTEVLTVMPLAVEPWHAIGMTGSTELTGIVGMFGVFMIAASDGIYKYTPRIDVTASYVRPSAAGKTWPASAVGKKLSIGAPGAAAVGGSDVLYVQQSDVSAIASTYERRVARLTGGASWATRVDPAAASQMPIVKLKKLGANLYRIAVSDTAVGVSALSNALAPGQLQRSTDTGATWANVGPSPINSLTFWWGVNDVAIGASGTLWLCACTSQDTGDAGLNPPRVYRSTDDGATWSSMYEDTTKDTGSWRRFIAICPHPTSAAIVATVGDRSIGLLNTWYSTDATAVAPTFTRTTGSLVQSAAGQRHALMLAGGRIIGIQGTGGTLSYTDDYGATWVNTGSTVGGSHSYALVRTASGIVFAAGGSTSTVPVIRRSTNQGTTWAAWFDDTAMTAEVTEFSGMAYSDATGTLYLATNSDKTGERVFAIAAAATTPTALDVSLNLDALLSGVGDRIGLRCLAV